MFYDNNNNLKKTVRKKIFFREITQVHEFVCFHGIFENSFF